MNQPNSADLLKWYKAMDIDEVLFALEPKNKANDKNTLSHTQNITKEEIMPQKKSSINKASLPMQTELGKIGPVSPVVQAAITARELAGKCLDLESLKSTVLNFDGCTLKFGAKNTVFSDGTSSAKIMLIGEAPGANEDEQGIPFCGESGKLLDNILSTIGLKRSKNFYISNTVFWRPPANRQPTLEEISICKPFVEKHISLINPELLILVGSTAVTSLLGQNLQITKIRQEYYHYTNIYLDKEIITTAIFHPAYLLRQPIQKKATWYDLLKIKNFINSNLPNYL